MVEEFGLPLRPAVGHDIWRGTPLVTTAQFAGGFVLAPLPGCGSVVFCCVWCLCVLFVWWWYLLWRVMYECFFLLYDVAVFLPFNFKKHYR